MKRLILILTFVAAIPFTAHGQDISVTALVCRISVTGSPVVQGEIKNLKSNVLPHVWFSIIYRDSMGNFISTYGNAAATFQSILPGQTSPFEGYGDADPKISQATIAPYIIMPGENKQLVVSGKQAIPCTRRSE